MNIAVRRFLAGVAAGAFSLLATASMVSPSLAEDGTSAEIAVPRAFLWSSAAVADLQHEVAASRGEGLDPANYASAMLGYILKMHGEGAQTDAAARQVAVALARDYAEGRVGEGDRIDWHFESTAPDVDQLAAGLEDALKSNRVRPWLRSLLPSDPRYAALRTALAATPVEDVEMRNRLRANLERWRWMPRALGADHIYVNVPSYSLKVVEDGESVSTYTVVVGKPETPTPLITAQTRAIVVNPSWSVPPSIRRHMKSTKGYEVKDGGRLVQPPGPRNALGKVKIDIANSYNIYLHDTPSKALFAEEMRAYSHGCIRVKDIDRLATELATLDQGDQGSVRKGLAGSATRTVSLEQSRPVYLVYFTADLGSDRQVVPLDDPYKRDERLIASLDSMPRLALNDPGKAKRG